MRHGECPMLTAQRGRSDRQTKMAAYFHLRASRAVDSPFPIFSVVLVLMRIRLEARRSLPPLLILVESETSMFARTIRYSLLTATILLLTGTGKAQAQFGVPYAWGGYGSSIYANERLPFYSLYPPVYYKQAIPRSYGYSPFAYPLGSPTPTPVSVSPQLLMNPFCPAAPAPAHDEGELADRPQPLTIRNPFVPDGAAALTSNNIPAPAARN
jgi:hypothetical protein